MPIQTETRAYTEAVLDLLDSTLEYVSVREVADALRSDASRRLIMQLMPNPAIQQRLTEMLIQDIEKARQARAAKKPRQPGQPIVISSPDDWKQHLRDLVIAVYEDATCSDRERTLALATALMLSDERLWKDIKRFFSVTTSEAMPVTDEEQN